VTNFIKIMVEGHHSNVLIQPSSLFGQLVDDDIFVKNLQLGLAY
jgi:hypothetical protein